MYKEQGRQQRHQKRIGCCPFPFHLVCLTLPRQLAERLVFDACCCAVVYVPVSCVVACPCTSTLVLCAGLASGQHNAATLRSASSITFESLTPPPSPPSLPGKAC